ncbi:hypothetical protein OEZ85_011239 [Tetradesmus obliquus]|uniref:Uncharacterized protein n=1 Tax=Tetradesmus obliquus TaxID=3088 RepID=A0ABY8TPP8_TETOB|nr:hypothetical protein OEZ85_011239 [Tetradesmus obliquus]
MSLQRNYRTAAAADAAFSIPTQMLLHGSLALSEQQYGAAFRALLRELGPGVCDSRSLLVLLLVVERAKGAASAWAPYIDMLPQQYDDPFWWSPDELALLQGSWLQQAVQRYTAR